jgi:glutathione S-transferase
MKFFYSPGVSALTARILIKESKVPVRFIRVRVTVGLDEEGHDFRARSESGKLPALCLDDDTLIESERDIALTLIAHMEPHPIVAPMQQTPAYQQISGCLNYLAEQIHPHFNALLRVDTGRTARTEAQSALQKEFNHLAGLLERQPYLLGETMTAPDAYAFTLLSWSELVEFDLTQWPSLDAYVKRLREQPSVAESLAEEGLNNGWRQDLQPSYDLHLRA